MTPDDLARFTPTAGPDAGGLLFRMGRASAPTRLRWKLAVVGLAVTNAAALGWIVFRPEPVIPTPDVVVVVVPVPVPELVAPHPTPGLLSYGVLRAHDDPDRWPAAAPLAGVAPPGPPLTPLAARRGDFD